MNEGPEQKPKGRRDFLKWLGAGAAAGVANAVTGPLVQKGLELSKESLSSPRIDIPTDPEGSLNKSEFLWSTDGRIGVATDLAYILKENAKPISFDAKTGKLLVQDSKDSAQTLVDEIIPLGESETEQLLIFMDEDVLIVNRTSVGGQHLIIQVLPEPDAMGNRVVREEQTIPAKPDSRTVPTKF